LYDHVRALLATEVEAKDVLVSLDDAALRTVCARLQIFTSDDPASQRAAILRWFESAG
jgi:hypothetical protein